MKRIASRLVACTGKGVLSAQQAKRLAREIRERGDRVVPYLCVHCKGWHVGSTLINKGGRRRPVVVDDGGLDG